MSQPTTEKEPATELEILNAKVDAPADDAVDGVNPEPDQLSLVDIIKKKIVKYIKLIQILIFAAVFLIVIIVSLFNVFAPKEKEVPEEKTNKLLDLLKKQGFANLAPVLDGTNGTTSD